MNDELTRLRAICGALLEYDDHIKQAAIDEMDECWDDAEDEERLAREALIQAVFLARKERR